MHMSKSARAHTHSRWTYQGIVRKTFAGCDRPGYPRGMTQAHAQNTHEHAQLTGADLCEELIIHIAKVCDEGAQRRNKLLAAHNLQAAGNKMGMSGGVGSPARVLLTRALPKNFYIHARPPSRTDVPAFCAQSRLDSRGRRAA